MKLNVAVYNMEWMKDLFKADGSVKTSGEDAARGAFLADVVREMDPDILGIVEGPDTTASGSKKATTQLKTWANHHGLASTYKAVSGFVSRGQQELCALFKSDKVTLTHKPTKAMTKHPFNEPFLVDTTDTLIKEHYEHFRPPLELSVKPAGGGDEMARIIVAHTKSKGIFDKVDSARFVQVSERNRKKLFAECLSIRGRVDQWLTEDPNRHVIVMGDINDGFGMDFYERRYAKSAVDLLLGDVWEPELILKHVLPQPKLGRYGWTPSTSRFTDKGTGDRVNVLIDHILVSQGVKVDGFTVWNPFYDHKEDATNQKVDSVKDALFGGADHFPVSAVMTL
ncbi:MAG: endonuclease/exonuclease/phosphatase family protein [Thermoanaerobaculia bacterium]